MKNYHIIIIGLCLLLSSCAPAINYFGDKLPPTTSVDVFYSAHDVTKPYKVIGHLSYLYVDSQDVIKAQLTAYAQKIGADALIITGSTINNGSKSGSDVVNADAVKYN